MEKHYYIYIADKDGNHVFSVEEGNTVRWTDEEGKMHTVKSELDLDSALRAAMRAFTNWIINNK